MNFIYLNIIGPRCPLITNVFNIANEGACLIKALSKPTIITDDGVISMVISGGIIVTVACVFWWCCCPLFMCASTLHIMDAKLILHIPIILKEIQLTLWHALNVCLGNVLKDYTR